MGGGGEYFSDFQQLVVCAAAVTYIEECGSLGGRPARFDTDNTRSIYLR